jgi:hypothetical protein
MRFHFKKNFNLSYIATAFCGGFFLIKFKILPQNGSIKKGTTIFVVPFKYYFLNIIKPEYYPTAM